MADSGCSELEPYALRVLGDSLEQESPDGCIVMVNPGYAAEHGSYVIVECAGDVFFHRLAIEGERRYLEPLNPRYGRFELIPPYAICGGVVQRSGRRRAERKRCD